MLYAGQRQRPPRPVPHQHRYKRRTVTMLLDDPEWIQWSDREIARACDVSAPTIASVRRAYVQTFTHSPAPAAPSPRTASCNGTTYEHKVKARPAQENPVKPANGIAAV